MPAVEGHGFDPRWSARLGALAEANREHEACVAALDGEACNLARPQARDNSRNIFRPSDATAVDRHDHVAAAREVDPERAGGLAARAEPGLRCRAPGEDDGYNTTA